MCAERRRAEHHVVRAELQQRPGEKARGRAQPAVRELGALRTAGRAGGVEQDRRLVVVPLAHGGRGRGRGRLGRIDHGDVEAGELVGAGGRDEQTRSASASRSSTSAPRSSGLSGTAMAPADSAP